jgi:hypothetical protein
VRWGYYFQIGFDLKEQRKWIEREGPLGRFRYWKPFEAYAVERVIADYPGTVIDFGAGHSVYEEETLFSRVQAALAPVPHVVLLLPSPDDEVAVRVLEERSKTENDPLRSDLNAHFVRHPSNRLLATKTVYTEGRTPEETCDEIMRMIGTTAQS